MPTFRKRNGGSLAFGVEQIAGPALLVWQGGADHRPFRRAVQWDVAGASDGEGFDDQRLQRWQWEMGRSWKIHRKSMENLYNI